MGNVGLDRERVPSDAMGLAKLAGLGRLLTLCGSCASGGCAVFGDRFLLPAASSRSEKLEATPATISRSSLTLWQGAKCFSDIPAPSLIGATQKVGAFSQPKGNSKFDETAGFVVEEFGVVWYTRTHWFGAFVLFI